MANSEREPLPFTGIQMSHNRAPIRRQQGRCIPMTQQQKSKSWKNFVYQIAKWTWIITAWIWSTITATFLVQLVPIIITLQNPEKALQGTWVLLAFNWLTTTTFKSFDLLEMTKAIIRGGSVLLGIVPIVAFIVKQRLQHVEKEGLDKIVEFLEKDIISPQLDALQDLLKQQNKHSEQQNKLIERQNQLFDQLIDQQHRAQMSTIGMLGHISGQLQLAPGISTPQAQYTASQQQHATHQSEKLPASLPNKSSSTLGPITESPLESISAMQTDRLSLSPGKMGTGKADNNTEYINTSTLPGKEGNKR